MWSRMTRRWHAPALALVLAVGLPIVAADPAFAAATAGGRCARSNIGQAELDPATGATVVCTVGEDGMRWRTGQTAAVTPLPTAPNLPAPPRPRPAPGDRCAAVGVQTLDGLTAETMECRASGTGLAWVSLGAGRQLPPIVGTLVPPTGDGLGLGGSLPFEMGAPNGLPDGVDLPPGTQVMDGFPQSRDAIDYWKRDIWITQALISGTNLDAAGMESINDWFVAECSAIGWFHDPARVERLPGSPPPGRFYDTEVQMVLGECRTYLGTLTHPAGKRPWVLAWSVALRPGATQLELVVELRDTSRTGGRSA
jgi:hypothetical protein